MNKSENPLFVLGLQKSRVILFRIVLVAFFILLIGDAMCQSTSGNLMVMPRRAVFEGSKRSLDIVLANSGDDPATYEISFVNFRMNEDGSYTQIETPDSGQYFADPFVRIYPRVVTLAGKGSQTIKLQLTRTDKMKPGEYRSHLWFRANPDTKPLATDDKRKDTTEVSVRLIPIFGITIPVIIRTGPVSSKVQLTDLSMRMDADSLNILKMTIVRDGNISVYGDITVNYISPAGKKIQVAIVKGVGVYTPNPIRVFQCALENKKEVNYHSGKLQILYTDPVDTKAGMIAETSYTLR